MISLKRYYLHQDIGATQQNRHFSCIHYILSADDSRARTVKEDNSASHNYSSISIDQLTQYKQEKGVKTVSKISKTS